MELSTDTTRQRGTPRGASTEWGVFVCYRQDDGQDVAAWLFNALESLTLPFIPADSTEAPKLRVYFDQHAPGAGDWTKIHQPSLESARAFLLVCSPGAHTRLGRNDWVHRELEWWVKNRATAPIIIDPVGGGSDRWVPDVVKRRWPNAQRLPIELREWAQGPAEDRAQAERSVRDRIIGGIRESERATSYEDLERLAAVQARAKRWLAGSVMLLGLLLVTTLLFWWESTARKEGEILARANQERMRAAEQRLESAERWAASINGVAGGLRALLASSALDSLTHNELDQLNQLLAKLDSFSRQAKAEAEEAHQQIKLHPRVAEFLAGYRAWELQDWNMVLRHMEEALLRDPNEDGLPMRVAGAWLVPYVPNYFASLALLRLRQCERGEQRRRRVPDGIVLPSYLASRYDRELGACKSGTP